MAIPAYNTSVLRTAEQQTMVAIIDREFAAAGWKSSVIQAAIVNAYAESGLNPRAIGDGGKSVGLFQLHEKGGGAGMSTAQRQDPTLNTRRIIEETARALSFRAIAASTDDVPTLAAAFSTYVERPADKAGEEARRRDLAARIFPTSWLANAPSGSAMPSTTAPPRSTSYWYALAALAIVSVAAYSITRQRE
jgi:hypothetical protein